MTAIAELIFTLLAKIYIRRFRPRIVAVTGNAGKTSTRLAIAAVLGSRYRVRTAGANLNTSLGVAATILGAPMDVYERSGGTAGFWLRAFIRGIRNIISDPQRPEVMVLEYGADRPGDIARLVRAFPPYVSVVTQIGQVPVHVEFFASAEHLAQEKMQIIKHLQPGEHAVLNYDDQTVLDMRRHTQASIHTFGLATGADVQADDIETRLDGSVPLGVRFTLYSDGHSMPAVLNGALGAGIVAAAAAAVAVGSIFSVGLADAVDALAGMKPPAGRMRIVRGIRETIIIDDSYNASPAAMHLAIDTIRPLPGRKVLVLGDMLELGRHSIQSHQAVGTMAADIADVLVCVGERAKLYAQAASDQLDKASIHWFHGSGQAAPHVQNLLRSGDVVLVKGSQGTRMERIIREIMAEPERAGDLLARQSARWLLT